MLSTVSEVDGVEAKLEVSLQLSVEIRVVAMSCEVLDVDDIGLAMELEDVRMP
ncbi:hypothetical protein ES708_17473 [subsurface metagenome]